ncbi:MAG: hypothetical protein PHN44_01120 [Candidatus Marinimicrobia bacterium]|nr:hypothetical protein [Candidatus Neomarinimicrobiota bacterium]MDD5539106.1 hypothetical protein [Candidatus Neomarinimicrobiota bacterium]
MPATIKKGQTIRLAPASLPAADVCIIAANAPQSVKNWALIQKKYFGNLIQVCGEQGVEDCLAIQRGFDAGLALSKPFSVYFSAGNYGILAPSTIYPNMRFIFDRANFIATAPIASMFTAASDWTNISSEGRVSFDGARLAERCLFLPGPSAPASQDKYFTWNAITSITGFTLFGFAFSRGKHYRITDFTSIDQRRALSFTGFEDVSIGKWQIIYTPASPDVGVSASDFYPTSDPPFGRTLRINDVYIDCGYTQEHAFSSSPGADLLRSLEDVQIDHLYIKNAPKVDQTPIIWAFVLGFKMTDFDSDGAQIIIQASDVELSHGKIRRSPAGGLTIHPMAGGNHDIILDDIICCNNGHFAATTRPLCGIRIGGENAANPTVKVKMTNVRCYDDQDQMTNLLSADALAGQNQATMASLFSNKQWWYPGQQVTISDLTPDTENVEIASIDYATRVITFTANLVNNYTVAQTARITGIRTQKKGVWLSGYLRDVKFGEGCDFRGNTEHGVYEGLAPDGYAVNMERIEGNVKIVTVELDLSGAATDVPVYHATTPAQIIGYTLVYTEASSINAGVDVRLGMYNVGAALDDDYFDISVSEVSEALGYTKSFYFADMIETKIAEGDTLTFGTAGGKVGTGAVKAILQIVESSD